MEKTNFKFVELPVKDCNTCPFMFVDDTDIREWKGTRVICKIDDKQRRIRVNKFVELVKPDWCILNKIGVMVVSEQLTEAERLLEMRANEQS